MKSIAAIGILLNMAGVLLLFWFGMSFRTGDFQVVMLVVRLPTAEEASREKATTWRYKLLGYIDLSLVLIRSSFQFLAAIS
jgi:hypothetical protein